MTISEEKNSEQISRQLLLNFYSSEINTHGRVLIGFAALMFTILTVRVDLFGIKSLTDLQYWIFYSLIALVAWGIFYLLFRLIGYGILANSTIHAPRITTQYNPTTQSPIFPIVLDVSNHARKALFPIDWFFDLGKSKRQIVGFVISFVSGVVTTYLIYQILEISLR
jgi:hypothetical protein